MTEAAAIDVVLIGAGIMSATLGTFLKEFEPSLSISVLEVLSDCALESSGSWNNAGTGHAANCELNYTPQRPDGSVDISKALEVNTEFDLSRQLWAYLVRKGAIADPRDFIHPCPHMSFVWGETNVAFLKARFKAMSANHCYRGMEYSESHAEIGQWAPLIMEGRPADQPVAATRIITGTDVSYGALTHLLFDHLAKQPGVNLSYRHHVRNLKRTEWRTMAHRGRGPSGPYCGRDHRKVRLYRRWRRRAGAVAEVQYSRGTRIRRLPGERHLAPMRRARGRRAPRRQGLR